MDMDLVLCASFHLSRVVLSPNLAWTECNGEVGKKGTREADEMDRPPG